MPPLLLKSFLLPPSETRRMPPAIPSVGLSKNQIHSGKHCSTIRRLLSIALFGSFIMIAHARTLFLNPSTVITPWTEMGKVGPNSTPILFELGRDPCDPKSRTGCRGQEVSGFLALTQSGPCQANRLSGSLPSGSWPKLGQNRSHSTGTSWADFLFSRASS